jgi:hypothetical protein
MVEFLNEDTGIIILRSESYKRGENYGPFMIFRKITDRTKLNMVEE